MLSAILGATLNLNAQHDSSSEALLSTQDRQSPMSEMAANSAPTAERVRALAATKTGAVLLAFGREARDAGKFADALTYFQAASQSRAGRTEFQERFRKTLERLDDVWEDRFQPNLQLVAGRPKRGTGYNRQTDGLFGLFLDNFTDDSVKGQQRYRVQFEFWAEKKPAKPGDKANSFGVLERQAFFDRYMKDLTLELGKEFPANPLHIYKQDRYYFIEGVMNADFPFVAGQAWFELAKTYQAQGDYQLADQYITEILDRPILFPELRAIPNKRRPTNMDLRYEALYLRAEMYQILYGNGKVDEVLKQIVANDDQYNAKTRDPAGREVRSMSAGIQTMADAMLNRDIDRALEIYRYKDNFAHQAHVDLGITMIKRNNGEEALQHLAYAYSQTISTIIDELRKRDPNWQFAGLKNLLADLRDFPELQDYAKNSLLFDNLYYLAATLNARGAKPKNVREIWSIVANEPIAGVWADRAKIALQKK